MSVIKFISCGQHFLSFGYLGGLQVFSTLMMRLPGICLVDFDETLDADAEERGWKS